MRSRNTRYSEEFKRQIVKEVEENRTYTTSEFLKRLKDKLGFEIDLVQTDKGFESVNDPDVTNKNTVWKTIERDGNRT